ICSSNEYRKSCLVFSRQVDRKTASFILCNLFYPQDRDIQSNDMGFKASFDVSRETTRRLEKCGYEKPRIMMDFYPYIKFKENKDENECKTFKPLSCANFWKLENHTLGFKLSSQEISIKTLISQKCLKEDELLETIFEKQGQEKEQDKLKME